MSKCYVDTVVSLAKQEVGYIEKATNANLDDKTANAGNKNYNKYAKYIDTNYPTFYNGKKNGYEWCDVFVDCMFIQAYGLENAMRLLNQPTKSSGAGCLYSYRYFKSKNWTGKTPKVGAQVFFGTSENSISHTGLVVAVESTRFCVVEGNKNNKVEQNWYLNNAAVIVGFGYPPYDVPETTNNPRMRVITVNPSDIDEVVIQIER